MQHPSRQILHLGDSQSLEHNERNVLEGPGEYAESVVQSILDDEMQSGDGGSSLFGCFESRDEGIPSMPSIFQQQHQLQYHQQTPHAEHELTAAFATMDGRAFNSFAYATPTVVHSFGGAAAVGDVTQHQQQARQPQQAQHLPMSDEPLSLFAPSVQSTQVEELEAGKWSTEQPKGTGTSEEEEVDRLMEIFVSVWMKKGFLFAGCCFNLIEQVNKISPLLLS